MKAIAALKEELSRMKDIEKENECLKKVVQTLEESMKFEALDINNDGVIDASELEAGRRRMEHEVANLKNEEERWLAGYNSMPFAADSTEAEPSNPGLAAATAAAAATAVPAVPAAATASRTAPAAAPAVTTASSGTMVTFGEKQPSVPEANEALVPPPQTSEQVQTAVLQTAVQQTAVQQPSTAAPIKKESVPVAPPVEPAVQEKKQPPPDMAGILLKKGGGKITAQGDINVVFCCCVR